jgi:hypothetical protein
MDGAKVGLGREIIYLTAMSVDTIVYIVFETRDIDGKSGTVS